MMDDTCHVYIFGAPSVTFGYTVKVGISSNVGYRLNQVQACNPERIARHFSFAFTNRELAREAERRFHAKMDDCAIRNEWFALEHQGALFVLTLVVVDLLSETYRDDALALARQHTGLHEAFSILDNLPDDFHAKWNAYWEAISEVA